MKVKIKLSTGQEKVLDLDPRSTLGELLDRLRESDLLVGTPPRSLLASHPRDTPISATPIRSGEVLIAAKGSQASEATGEKDVNARRSSAAASSQATKNKEVIVLDEDESDEDVKPVKNPSAKRTLKNVRENLPRLESEQKRSRLTLKTTAPLFYQNPILELGTPESEKSCTVFLGSLVPEEHLEEAYILNYCVDLDLLIKPMFPQLRKVPVAFCISPGGVTQEMFEDCFPAVGSRLIFPKCPPYGTHHSKLLVLFYGNRGIRVIVHTSNMEITNMFMQAEGTWFQDFPLKKVSSETAASPSRENDFGEYLGRVLIASGISEANKTLARYDFSGAEVALVASFPRPVAYTSHSEIALTGMGRVIHLLEIERRKNPEWAAKIKDWPVVLQGSSLGSQASKVAPAGNWLVDELAKSMGAKDASKAELVVATMKEMLDSQFGPDGSKSTFFYKAHFQSDVVRRMLRTWTPANPKLPTRALLLPHFKSYLCYEPTKGREIGWAIVGSHNCTKAAWGSWTSSLKNKFTCISYELSVMFLPSIMRAAGTKRWSVEKADYYDVPLRDTFVSDPDSICDNEAWLPIPYNLPTHPYDFRENVPFTRD